MLLALAALVLAFAGDPAGPVVVVPFVAEDGKGVAIRNLKAEAVRVLQDGEIQPVTTFESGPSHGHYVLTYTPTTGRAGAVSVRVLRGGSVVRGPEGDFLRPKVIGGSSPLERELTLLLDAATDLTGGDARLAVFRFEWAPDGRHHTVAVDVPLSSVEFVPAADGYVGRVQLLTRVRDRAGRLWYRTAIDRPVEMEGNDARPSTQLVSTSDLHLPPGTYTVDAYVRDPVSGRAAARRSTVEVPSPVPAPWLSSVVLLQPSRAYVTRLDGLGTHDPLVHDGTPLLPAFEPTFATGERARARFFFALHPAASGAPPTAEVEIWRDGAMVGKAPVALPSPGADGVVRHVAGVPTHTFRPARYTLRLTARQADAVVTEDASFVVADEERSAPRR